jgi:hypothetical protein
MVVSILNKKSFLHKWPDKGMSPFYGIGILLSYQNKFGGLISDNFLPVHYQSTSF